VRINIFEVGGCVRDDLLGIPSKDVDFVVIAPSFGAMHDHIENTMGLKVFMAKEEFATIRAGVPKDHWLRSRCKDADFVLARKDGPSSDGRRPDFVEPGSLKDDLQRRDFTINALARNVIDGSIIDLFGGRDDLERGILRFVGGPMKRIEEDGLRVIRGFRFEVTKRLVVHPLTGKALVSARAAKMLSGVAVERIREELEKMLRFDSMETLRLLSEVPLHIRKAIFRDGLRLSASMKA